ncbi:MAG: MFS transporter [Lachnospiraceae bacterium]|nr:MFS transporter [Lachnospiraceae bacterium]
MKNWSFRKYMIFFILSATVAFVYQIPYLRYSFYDQMCAAFNLNNTEIGMLGTAVNLTATLTYPLGGILASRYSTKRLLIVTNGAMTILSVLFAISTNFSVLLVIHVLLGFFSTATIWSAYLVGLRSLGDERNQSIIFGSSEAVRGIVQTVLGFLFLAIVAKIASPVLGMRSMLFVAAAFAAIITVLSVIYIPSEMGVEKDETGNTKKVTLVDVIKHPGVWIVCFLIIGCFQTYSVGNGYMTTYCTQVLAMDQSTASMIGIVRNYIIVFVGGFIGGFIMDKFTIKGKGLCIMIAGIIAAIFGVMFTSAVPALSIALTVVVALLANCIKSTYWSTMDQAGIPVYMTALATGFISFIGFAPDFITPTLAGRWIDAAVAAGNVKAGFDKVFIMMACFGIIALISAFILWKRTDKAAAEK